MKTKTSNSLMSLALAIAVSLPLLGTVASAQKQKPNSRIEYHGGPVMFTSPAVYFIWYGCWSGCSPGSNPDTQHILVDFITRFGGSPYAMINTTYPGLNGAAPTGGLVFGGSVDSGYSRGPTLAESDVEGIITDRFQDATLPLDTTGIFIVLASSDVDAPGFCSDRCQYHRTLVYNGSTVR